MIHIDADKTEIRGPRIDIYSELASLSHGLKVIGYSDVEIINSIKLGLAEEEKDMEELGTKVLEAAMATYLDKLIEEVEE